MRLSLTFVCCGALWAAGNFCALRAVAGLGQAAGFPLTQVCVLVSAALGVFGFGELAGPGARPIFAAGAVAVLGGAALLGGGAASQPSEPVS